MNQTPPIARSKSVFVRGFAQPAELKTWLENHVDIRGVTFLGRSNVGKSSIINAIFKNDIARVSNTPGRTQEINLFNFYFEKEDKPYYLFDLPGFGHATVSKQTSQNWDELMHTFFTYLTPGIHPFWIQDARHPMQKSDLEFLQYFEQFGRKISLVLNKVDKIKSQKEKNEFKTALTTVGHKKRIIKFINPLSALTKEGLPEIEAILYSETHGAIF